ncbi:MAG: Xaa-Pro peptidase family protein [Chloroflexota bacterium]|nr:Xaa-Pro peptidase family protein [Chloroflexota bacterium]
MNDRLNRVDALLRERSLDAVLVTNPSNRRYLSGFTAEDHAADESAGVLLIAPDARIILSGATNLPWARAEAPGFEPIAWERPWPTFIGRLINERGWRSVGFEDGTTTVADYRLLGETLTQTELIPLLDALDALRAVKTDEELELVARVIRLTDDAFAAGVERLHVGITERELADHIGNVLRELGSDGEAFPTIVASGPNAAKPHHAPGDRAIQDGEPVIIDMGARLEGYNGDLTRTVWTGDIDERLAHIYDVVFEAQQAALGAVRAGVSGMAVDQRARDVCERHGLGEYVLHGVGHGLGLRVHEAPTAGPKGEAVLDAGQVVTIEPGLYIDGWGGVRIEDVVVVEADGCRNLTGAPKNRT